MSFYPNSIEQINDFSGKAGDRLVDVLGNAPSKVNYAQYILKAINDKTRADESQRLTEAVDAYNRAMEAGKSASEALEGLDPRMTGSKAFKDEADKIRASILGQRANDRAEAMWANTLRQQAMQEEATKYASDLFTFANKVGGDSAGIWLNKNIEALRKNPHAFKAVTDLAKMQGYSFAPYTAPEEGAGMSLIKPEDLQSIEGKLNHLVGRLSAKGINTSISDEEALKLSNFDTWVKSQAERLGYLQDAGKYSDFRENMQMAYNQLRKVGGDLPTETILYAMQTNMDNGGLWWFDQEDINMTPAENWLRNNAKNWYKDFNDARTINSILGLIKKANDENQMQKSVSAYSSRAKNVQDLIASGPITEKEGKDILSKYVASLNTTNSDLFEAAKKAEAILRGRSL